MAWQILYLCGSKEGRETKEISNIVGYNKQGTILLQWQFGNINAKHIQKLHHQQIQNKETTDMWLLGTDPRIHLSLHTNRNNIKTGDLLFVIDAHNLKINPEVKLYYIIRQYVQRCDTAASLSSALLWNE